MFQAATNATTILAASSASNPKDLQITSLQKMAEHKTFPESPNKHMPDPL
jgi:hypothetical protein